MHKEWIENKSTTKKANGSLYQQVANVQSLKCLSLLNQAIERGLNMMISTTEFQFLSSSTWRARLTGVRIRVDYVLSWKAGFTLLEVR